MGDASALGFFPSHHVARDVQENQRGKNNKDVDDVAVAKHGAPVVAQGEAEVLAKKQPDDPLGKSSVSFWVSWIERNTNCPSASNPPSRISACQWELKRKRSPKS